MSSPTSGWDDVWAFLRFVSPQVIGVLIAGLIFQRYFVARSNECAFIDYLVKELDALRNDAVEYWSLEVNVKNREKARLLEAKVKGAIKSLNSELRSYSQRYDQKSDFTSLMAEVSDACTGGEFEAAARNPDTGRYLSVVNSLHRVKWSLIRRKL